MNTAKKDGKQSDNMKLLKEQASACGPGCGCHTTGTSGNARWVIGVIVLVAAGVMVVRAMTKSGGDSMQAATTGFANPAAAQSAAGGAATSSDAAAAAADETTVGTTLGAFAELNTTAAKTDAVFIFLPGKEGTSAKAPSAPMKAVVRTMEAKGVKCGLFTLKPGTRDYDQIAKQTPVPGVLALVKGRGMSAVSGEVTEAKLLQGYVAAGSASKCGSGAGAGCCPK